MTSTTKEVAKANAKRRVMEDHMGELDMTWNKYWILIRIRGTRILSVCPFAKYTFPVLDGGFTPKLLLPYRNAGQQQ
jgi:hypothetical protein